jgi:hypothetical protein
MNDTLPKLPRGPHGADTEDPVRRRLLRAAASAAPLIATLPSGAALAVASAYQCVPKDKTASDELADTPPSTTTDFQSSPPPPTDRWLRIAATRQRWVKGAKPADFVYAISFPSDDTFWYLESGERFDTTGYRAVGRPETVAVLRIYSENALAMGDLSDSCTVTVPTGANPPNSGCVFPVARRGVGDNMGLTGSCWTSIPIAP